MAVAGRMRAQCTVLTHFSQRYPHAVEPPAADEDNGGGGGSGAGTAAAAPYCVAFDGMHLPSNMFPHVSVVLQVSCEYHVLRKGCVREWEGGALVSLSCQNPQTQQGGTKLIGKRKRCVRENRGTPLGNTAVWSRLASQFVSISDPFRPTLLRRTVISRTTFLRWMARKRL